jgi:pimeloyl-ACP methyl ester carboxylesterase
MGCLPGREGLSAQTERLIAHMVGGDASPQLYPLSTNGLQPCLRTVERVTIPRASHSVHVDNPMDFNRATLEFVGRH